LLLLVSRLPGEPPTGRALLRSGILLVLQQLLLLLLQLLLVLLQLLLVLLLCDNLFVSPPEHMHRAACQDVQETIALSTAAYVLGMLLQTCGLLPAHISMLSMVHC
jgi:hypothetical protein